MRKGLWHLRLLRVLLCPPLILLAACGAPTSHPDALLITTVEPKPSSAPVAGDPRLGRELLVTRGCATCHRVQGVPEARGSVGPDLSGIASRGVIAGGIPNTPENLERWIADPPAMKPGTAMPRLGLSDAEADDLVAFLETLK